MTFRVATLNLLQDQTRWEARRELVLEQFGAIRPDVLALNEVSVPCQSARWLRDEAHRRFGIEYHLVQQTKTNGSGAAEAEALLTRFPVTETGNLDYRTRDIVALVARILVDRTPLDVYVTHLAPSRLNDALRLYEVQQLLAWIDARADVGARVVCGDFNATLDQPSAALMASRFRPTQTAATAFTALSENGKIAAHPEWPRMDRCIDYIWVSEGIRVARSRVCFNQPGAADPTLWPSDHAGVWADLDVG